MEMPLFFMVLDPYLIWCYRLPGDSYAGFFLGTLALAVLCLIIGEATAFVTLRLVGQRMEHQAAEALRYGELSIDAAKAGDKPSFKAANKLANEAFGKSFFSLMALSMARLWPLPFALAWMQYRFLGVEFPLPYLGFSLGFIGAFIIIYAAFYILGNRIKKKLLFFRRMNAILDPDPTWSREPQGLPALAPPILTPDQKS
ncbi:MAG: hypothetical protein ACOZF2_09420 [Thermodesulfobacteriota bacterium]